MSALLIIFLILLILFSAFTSASETSLFSLSSFTIHTYEHSSKWRQKIIGRLLAKPRDLMVTILMLNIFANVLIQNIVSALFGNFPSWLIKVGVPLLLTLFFGEVLPKSIALPNNILIAQGVAPAIYWAEKLTKFLRIPLTETTKWVSRICFFFLKKEKGLSLDELKHVLETSSERGVLSHEESELVYGYLDLQEMIVREKMTPKNELFYYDMQKQDFDELSRLFLEQKISRIPVSDGEIDHLVGVLSLETFFKHYTEIKEGRELESFLEKPFYVPEMTKAWTLLCQLRNNEESMAVVVNEYGSIQGIVTQEDLIESIFGEIEDERELHSHYTRSEKGVIIASGQMTLEEFEDLFDTPLPTKTNAVTIAGWLIEQYGDIPQTGSKYHFQDYLFYVLAADQKQVKRVYIRKYAAKRGKR